MALSQVSLGLLGLCVLWHGAADAASHQPVHLPKRLLAASQAGRMLQVDAVSDTQTSDQVTEGYTPKTDANVSGPFAMPDFPLWDAAVVRKVTGLTPDQLSVTYWAPGAYLLSWATGFEQVGVGITPPRADAVESVVEFGYTFPKGNDTLPSTSTGSALTYKYIYSTTPGFNLPDYASPVIHHTFISGIPANTVVFYRVGDPRYGWSDIRNFTSLPEGFPAAFTVIGDPGQTVNTSVTLERALLRPANLAIIVGDLSYADTFNQFGSESCKQRKDFNDFAKQYNLQAFPGACPKEPPEGTHTGTTNYQPKWDAWARLFQPLFSHIPTMQLNGNHEIEYQPDGGTFTAYNARYPQPQKPGVLSFDTSAVPSSVKGGDNNLYSAAEIPGVATVIMLTSLQPSVTFGGPNDGQYVWLKERLAAVDRSKTPWLVVNFHVPWYTTGSNYKTNECMRQAYEPLLLEAQVDVVFNGHVHSYERSHPVANFSRNDCGIVHIVVGNGGNHGGLDPAPNGWIDQIAHNTSWCIKDPTTRKFPTYQPQRCFSYQDELPGPYHYCPFSVPSWQAHRDASFGSGTLKFINSTSAVWEHFRNQDEPGTVSDRVYLTRTPDRCQNAFRAAPVAATG